MGLLVMERVRAMEPCPQTLRGWVRLSSSVNVNIVNHVSLFAMGLITLAKKNYLKMTKSHLLRVKQISLPKALY